jgi:hypothetical protein
MSTQQEGSAVGATRLVRCSSFIWVGWLMTVALLTVASIMNSVAVTRLRQEVFALRATRTMPQVPQESPRSLSPRTPELSSNAEPSALSKKDGL